MVEDDKDNGEKVQDPGALYHVPPKKEIRFYSSVQGQEEELLDYWATLTPVQRLAHLHELIIASYGLTEETLQNHKPSKTIKFH
jgi:hypothetical protein